jgi:UDP-N-acetylmuramoylalanine--D-glutamate ligase
VAGNIGQPLIASLDLEKPRTYVLELSSFQLETVDTFRANIALLLNITPDHMDRYPSFDAYAASKYRIFRNQQKGDTAIVNASERRASPRPGCRPHVAFSASEPVDEGAFLDGDAMVLRIGGEDRRIPRASLKLAGLANVENALASWLAARAVGVDDVAVQIAFGTFAGLPHRMVLVRERDGVRYVNDSKGTNVDATKSLEGFLPATVLLILGGTRPAESERRELVAQKRQRAFDRKSPIDRLEGVSRTSCRWAYAARGSSVEHAGRARPFFLPACRASIAGIET